MKNIITNIIENKKKWLIGTLIALLSLTFLGFIFTMVTYGTASYSASATTYIISIINTCVSLAVYAFGLVAVLKDEQFWCKVLFVTFFSYQLFMELFSVQDGILYFGFDAFFAFYGIIMILDALCVVAIGVIYLLNKAGIIKDERITDILVYVRFAILSIALIMIIVGIAQDNLVWTNFFVPIVSATITLLFFVGTRPENSSESEETTEINE